MQAARRGGSFTGFLVALVVGGVLGAGVCYYVLGNSAVASSAKAPTPAANAPAVPVVGPEPEDYITRKLRQWNLTPDEIKRDLARARDVVREKGRVLGDKVKAATADATVIAKIKAKYTLDDQLSALAIIVDSRDGHVKLSGKVASVDLIGRAIVLALDTDGVTDVVSSLQVETKPEPI